MASFRSVHYSVGADGDSLGQDRLRSLGRGAPGADPGLGLPRPTRLGAEAASRRYLQTFLEDTRSEEMAAITSPERAELVPDMRLESAAPVPDLDASALAYQQTAASIPVFGGRIVVDVDAHDRSLVAINGQLTPPPSGVSPIATLSARQALDGLAAWGKREPAALDLAQPPALTWFLDEDTGGWHLVYHVASARMEPVHEDEGDGPQPFADVPTLCVGHAPGSAGERYDYFVDAHDGRVVFFFSSAPHQDVPVAMTGDGTGGPRDFLGLSGGGGTFILYDPQRNIETFDYGNGDLDERPPLAFPASAIRHTSPNLGAGFEAAVDAHCNAATVYDFYNTVLQRDGIDDKGMRLVSVVNVYSSANNPLPPPQWANAAWWRNMMWYGQVNNVSFAKHLDVIAHELTHGVTSTSSNLVYRRLPGALNESFSDIFGILVANWSPRTGFLPLGDWTWTIGAGLGRGGGPLRDFSNPAATRHPDHFGQYVPLPLSRDHGGVHIYSGIHNKAVHNLLTGTDADGKPTFPVQEAALLLYLTLTRLTATSDFHASRRTLENVVRTYHAGDPALQGARLAAVAAAFGAVGL